MVECARRPAPADDVGVRGAADKPEWFMTDQHITPEQVCPAGPQINITAWVFCRSWCADFEFRGDTGRRSPQRDQGCTLSRAPASQPPALSFCCTTSHSTTRVDGGGEGARINTARCRGGLGIIGGRSCWPMSRFSSHATGCAPRWYRAQLPHSCPCGQLQPLWTVPAAARPPPPRPFYSGVVHGVERAGGTRATATAIAAAPNPFGSDAAATFSARRGVL